MCNLKDIGGGPPFAYTYRSWREWRCIYQQAGGVTILWHTVWPVRWPPMDLGYHDGSVGVVADGPAKEICGFADALHCVITQKGGVEFANQGGYDRGDEKIVESDGNCDDVRCRALGEKTDVTVGRDIVMP